jgi:hypothetical protein
MADQQRKGDAMDFIRCKVCRNVPGTLGFPRTEYTFCETCKEMRYCDKIDLIAIEKLARDLCDAWEEESVGFIDGSIKRLRDALALPTGVNSAE